MESKTNGRKLRLLFDINDDIVFLEHGFGGIAPNELDDAQQNWRAKLRHNPPRFTKSDQKSLVHESRVSLASFLSVAPSDLVLLPSVTLGVNIIARSLQLCRGDEIVSTEHEHRTCDYVWEHVCHKSGAVYKRAPISYPVISEEDIVEQIWAHVSAKTKLLFLSHISAPTSIKMPVKTLCERASKAGIVTVIDGAHAPGLIPLQLESIGADYYIGSCHKWMCNPKGAAFIYANNRGRVKLEPLIVSWGYSHYKRGDLDSPHIHEDTSIDDISAILTIPNTVNFNRKQQWIETKELCKNQARESCRILSELPGYTSVYADTTKVLQMFSLRLPFRNGVSIKHMIDQIYDQRRIEIPIFRVNNDYFLRVSFQAYNTLNDIILLRDSLLTFPASVEQENTLDDASRMRI